QLLGSRTSTGRLACLKHSNRLLARRKACCAFIAHRAGTGTSYGHQVKSTAKQKFETFLQAGSLSVSVSLLEVLLESLEKRYPSKTRCRHPRDWGVVI